MTISSIEKRKTQSKTRETVILVCIFVIIASTFFASNEIRLAIISGIRLSAFNVIPAIFPFLIISDYISSVEFGSGDGVLSRIFSRLFGVNPVALRAFICGTVCGFPIGIKMASALYGDKNLSKNELERLIGFSSNPSLAFVISGIGVGIYNSIKCGLILYISILLASVFIGILFKIKSEKKQNTRNNSRQIFNIAKSIKDAGLSSIFIMSYIIFFSALIGLLSKFVKNDTALALASSLLEITSASKMLSGLSGISVHLRLSLTAFALSFSGLCFALQARNLLPSEISMKKYYKMKIVSAVTSFFICYLLVMII